MEHSRYPDSPARADTAPALQALADYLELALDDGESFALFRLGANACQVLIGDPEGTLDDMTGKATIPAFLADEMLALTQDGTNVITVGGQSYRFTRSGAFTDNRAAVVFTPS
jgi:hypothetical protein